MLPIPEGRPGREVSPRSRLYQPYMEENLAAIKAHGLSLGRPDAALIAAAEEHAPRRRENRAWVKGFKHSSDRAQSGHLQDPNTVFGLIGEELHARLFHTHATWNDSGHEDGGVDQTVFVGGHPVVLQVKTNQGFMSEHYDHGAPAITSHVDYYAMVYCKRLGNEFDGEYIFCGWITPANFLAKGFAFWADKPRHLAERPQWVVLASKMDLTPAQLVD